MTSRSHDKSQWKTHAQRVDVEKVLAWSAATKIPSPCPYFAIAKDNITVINGLFRRTFNFYQL
jgi:hypothetical protein